MRSRRKLSLRKKYWMFLVGWLICIYASLSFVRPVCNFLKTILPLDFFINILIIGILGLIGIFFVVKVKSVRLTAWLMLAGMGVVYGYGLMIIEHPEEKVHFIQYGVLAFLAYQALYVDWSRWRAYIGAWVLSSLIGWADEGIQYLLPYRYYQLSDVFLNAISALLGLVLTWIIEREKRYLKGQKEK